MRYKHLRINAVLIDFDCLGTPGKFDFSPCKKAIGCPADRPVMEFIAGLADPLQREKARAELDRFELAAAAFSEPNPGAEDLIPYLRSKGIRSGVFARNSRGFIERALANFENLDPPDFDLLLTRDETESFKFHPGRILQAAESMNAPVDETAFVSDSISDIQAAKTAGAITVFLEASTETERKREEIACDYRIGELNELKNIIRMTAPLPAGKFPNDLLEQFFGEFHLDDPSVLIHPGVGEDTAAVDIEKEQVLVLKSDPITFATDAIGQYAVIVNANDIATSGAKPRWLLTTLLFPCGTVGGEIWETMLDLQEICGKFGITLCGGHTEITDAVVRPVIIGMLAGTVPKNRLLDKRNIRSGDRILLTKAIAVEGTAIIAREFADRLKRLGMPEADISACREFLSRISILEEAQIAAGSEGVSAMHDITEGGLATALKELSSAGGHRIRVEMDRIPVFPQTEKISQLLGIDPLGLIGSGSLLICCRENAVQQVMKKIGKAGIAVTPIGEVLDPGKGVSAVRFGTPAPWPSFEVDEITRLFE